MAGNGQDIGYYVMPVIPSFDGVEGKLQAIADKSIGGAATKAGRGFGKNLADGIKSSEAQVKAALDNMSKLQDKAADATGKLATAEAKLQSLQRLGASNARIVAATEARNKAKRDEARALKDAAEATAKYEEAQKRASDGAGRFGDKIGSTAGQLSGVLGRALEKFSGLAEKFGGGGGEALGASLDKLSSGASGLGGALAEAGGGAAAFGAAAGVAAGAGIAALVAGVVAGTKALYDLGSEFDSINDSLVIKTGATGDQLAALQESIKNVGRTTPIELGKIGDVVAEVNRDLHLTGPELDEVSKRIALLGEMTGESTNIRELGKLFRGFKVDAQDQAKTLDQLFGVWQKTGVPINELIGTVVKGGAALRQSGLDFGEAAGLIASLEANGLDANKAVAALAKNLATMSKKEGITGSQALRQTITQLQQLTAAGRDAEALNLANKLFGAKSGVQFFDAVKSGALDLKTLEKGLDDTGSSIVDTASSTDDLAEKWQTFTNNAAIALEPVGSAVFDLVNVNLESMITWVQTHEGDVIEFFASVADITLATGQAVGVFAASFVEELGYIIGGIGNFLGAGAKATAWVDDLLGRHDRAEEGRKEAEEFFKWGEDYKQAADKMFTAADGVDKLRSRFRESAKEIANAARFTDALGESTANIPDDKQIHISENTPEVTERLDKLGIEVKQLPDGSFTVVPKTDQGKKVLDDWRKSIEKGKPAELPLTLNTSDAENQLDDFQGRLSGGIGDKLYGRTNSPRGGNLGGNSNGQLWIPGITPPPRAAGGIFDVWDSVASFADGKLPSQALIQAPVAGAGLVQWAEPSTGGEAFIPLDGGARSVAIWMETGRRLMKYDQGGFRGPDVLFAESMVGTEYSQGARNDCSGMVARVINRALGLPDEGLMSTRNAAEWLAARGFKPGLGGPGTISVGWYNHGPNPNDGHMAMTLSDGRSAESGGSHGNFLIGAGAAGAADGQFDQHMYLPTLFGEGQGGGGAAGLGGLLGGGGFGGGSGGGGPRGPSAYGMGYEPGPLGSSPGYDQYGRPGYYETDPKRTREAEERANDAQQRVKDADAQVKIAEARKDELDFDASESSKLSADHALEKAKADAEKARREAKDAQTDLEETKKGKFTEAKERSKNSRRGDDAGGDLVRTLFGGALETFGMDGSWLPNIEDLGIVKLAKAVMGIKYTPQGTGFAGGLLQGVPGAMEATTPGVGGGGGSLPFGMIPGVASALPPLGDPGIHQGTGNAPGPVDASTNVTINNPQGDERSIADRTRRVLLNTPRVDTYAAPGGG